MKINCDVIPSVFTGTGRFGDWAWMREQAHWAHTLFVFNDNEEQFDAFAAGSAIGFSKCADPLGTYTRIIAHRDIDPQDRRQFKYHFACRNPRQMKSATTKTWQRICSLPAHAGWQDEYAYDLFKEVL